MARATYEARGVSAHKEDIHAAVRHMPRGLFPTGFCKAVPDTLTGSAEHCLLLHADGAGTKSSLAYLWYRETGDARVFESIAQDSIVMNLDDLLCVGCVGPFVYSNTIGRNKQLVPGEVIEAIVRGYERFAASMAAYGIELASCGGETADVGDLVRTVIVDSTVCARMRRAEYIDAGRVKAGHVIVGLASFGQAAYESTPNSGAGTNGFTAMRHELLSSRYRSEFPESYAPQIGELAYTGKFELSSPLPGSDMTVGEALLSPTRTYAPVVKRVLERCRPAISAMFHNTGGGLTKCLPFGEGVRYVKDNLFPLPPLFALVREAAGMPAREMARVLNCGQRFEIVCEPEAAGEIVGIAEELGVGARVIGRVEAQASGASVVVTLAGETVEFTRAG